MSSLQPRGPIGRLLARIPRTRTSLAIGGVALVAVGSGVGFVAHARADAAHRDEIDNVLKKVGLGPNGLPVGQSGAQATTSPGVGAPSASVQASATPSGAGGNKPGAKATPSNTPFVMPTPYDAIYVEPDYHGNGCQGNPRGFTCTIPVQGMYYLKTRAAGQVVIQVIIDGNVATSHTISPAPKGGYRINQPMTFTIPKNANEIDYVGLLEDSTGNLIVKSQVYQTYAN